MDRYSTGENHTNGLYREKPYQCTILGEAISMHYPAEKAYQCTIQIWDRHVSRWSGKETSQLFTDPLGVYTPKNLALGQNDLLVIL